MNDLQMIDMRLATGAITVAEYDQIKSRITYAAQAQDAGTGGKLSNEDIDHHVRLYEVYRGYVEHEDDLINQRLSWNFSIQGLLFAAYAFAFQKSAELWKAVSDSALITTTISTVSTGTAVTTSTASAHVGLSYLQHSLVDIHLFRSHWLSSVWW